MSFDNPQSREEKAWWILEGWITDPGVISDEDLLDIDRLTEELYDDLCKMDPRDEDEDEDEEGDEEGDEDDDDGYVAAYRPTFDDLYEFFEGLRDERQKQSD